MWTRRINWIMFGLALMLPLAACDDGTTGPGDGTATLSIYLTDARGDVEAVWVELLALTAQGGEGGPVDLLGGPTDLILLTDLVGTVHFLSMNTGLDPTTFRQLRLVVGDVVLKALNDTVYMVYIKGDPILPVELEDFDQGELQCPSCSQSGIKVKVPNDEIVAGEGSAALVLDFDVAQSFGHKAGNSGKWVMKPVILGALVEGDSDGLGLVGSVSGTVDPITILDCPDGTTHSILDFVPTATLDGFLDGEDQPIVRTGTMEADGTFQIGFLPSGSFTMGYLGAIDVGPGDPPSHKLVFTADVFPGQVTIPAPGEKPTVAFTNLTATCQVAG